MVSSSQPSLRTPTQTRAHRTRASLVSAAAVEFGARGYAGTTAKSIAKRAGVAVGSFYQYFPNKDEVLHELGRTRGEGIFRATRERIRSQQEVMPTQPHKRVPIVLRMLTEIIEGLIAYHRVDKHLHAVLTERRHADARLDRITGRLERGMVETMAEHFAAWTDIPDPQAAAFVTFGAIEGAVHAHVLGDALVDDERLTATLVTGVMAIAYPDGIPQAPAATPSARA